MPDTEEYRPKYTGMGGPVEVYVAVNRKSTAEFKEMNVGQKFRLMPK